MFIYTYTHAFQVCALLQKSQVDNGCLSLLLYLVAVCFRLFETWSHYVDLTDLELTM